MIDNVNIENIEDLIFKVTTNGSIIVEKSMLAEEIETNKLVLLESYKLILNQIENLDIEITNSNIGNFQVFGFQDFLNKYNLNDNINKKQVLNVLEENIDKEKKSLLLLEKEVKELINKSNIYISEFIKDYLDSEIFTKDSSIISKKLQELNNFLEEQQLPLLPFDTSINNLDNLKKQMNTLDYFVSLSSPVKDFEYAVLNLKSAGLSPEFALPIENLEKLRKKSSDNNELYRIYINKLGKDFSKEHFSDISKEVENDIDNNIKQINEIFNNLSIENPFNFDKINEDIDVKIDLLIKTKEALNFSQDLKKEQNPINFLENNKNNIIDINDINNIKNIKISNINTQMSNEDLIGNLKKHSDILKITDSVVYKEAYISDIQNIILNYILENDLMASFSIDTNNSFKEQLLKEIPELKEVSEDILNTSLNTLNHLDEFNKNKLFIDENFVNFDNLKKSLNEFLSFDTLSEDNKKIISEMIEYLNNLNTSEIFSFDLIETFNDKLLISDNYKITLLLKNLDNNLIKISNSMNLDISIKEMLYLFENPKVDLDNISIRDKEDTSFYEKVDLLFYQIGNSPDFIKMFEEEIANDSVHLHTDELFLKTLSKFDVDLYQEILNYGKGKEIIGEFIDIFNSSDFKLWKYMQVDKYDIFELLEAETHSEDFKNRYKTIQETFPNKNDYEIFFETLTTVNPELLKQFNVKNVEEFEKKLNFNFNFNFFREKVKNFRTEEENIDLVTNKTILSNFIKDITPEEFDGVLETDEKLKKDYKDGKFEAKMKVLYNIIKKDNRHLLSDAQLGNFHDFKYFYINDRNISMDKVSLLQSDLAVLNQIKFFDKFLEELKENIDNNKISEEVDLELGFKALEIIKKSNMNMSVKKMKDVFEFKISKDEELLKIFQEFKNNEPIFSKIKKDIIENKEILISPKRNLGINSSFVPTVFDDINNDYYAKFVKLEEEFNSLNLLDSDFIENLADLKPKIESLNKNIKLQFLFDNLEYIVSNSDNEEIKNTFLQHFEGKEEEAEKVFKEEIEKFKKVFTKVKKSLEAQEIRNKLSEELDTLEAIVPMTTDIEDKIEEINVKLEDLEEDKKEAIDFSNNVEYLLSIETFQKKINTLNKKTNTLFKPNEDFIHDLTLFQDDLANKIEGYEMLSNFLIDDNFNNPNFNLRLKSILEEMVKNNFISKEESEEFYTHFINNADSVSFEEFSNLLNNFIETNYQVIEFIEDLVEHLLDENIKTSDFITNTKENFDNEAIFKILTILRNKSIINEKGYKEAVDAFELTPVHSKISLLKEKEKEERNEKLNTTYAFLNKQIKGKDESNGKLPTFGSASNILFEVPYSQILDNFKFHIQNLEVQSLPMKKNISLLKALEEGNIEDFNKKFRIKNHGNISLDNLLEDFLASEIMKDYPNHGLSKEMIHNMIFDAGDENFFFAKQISKTKALLKNGFKNDLMKQTKERQIKELNKEIKQLAEQEGTQFYQFKENNEKIKQIDKEIKQKEDELDRLKQMFITIKTQLELSGIDLNTLKTGENPAFDKYKADIENLEGEIKTLNSNKREEINSKNKNSKNMDDINSKLLKKRELLSDLNTNMEDNERFQNATLAQRLYLFGDNNELSEQEILNMKPEQMREQYMKNRNRLPLTEEERMDIIKKEKLKKEMSQGVLETLKDRTKKQVQKLPYLNPLSIATRNMQHLGYKKSSRYVFEQLGMIAGKTMWRSSKPFLHFILKEGIKNAYPGQYKNAEAQMSKITGMNLNTSLPSLKDVLNFAVEKVRFKQELEERKKAKQEAPKKVEESLNLILEQLKHSSSPNKKFVEIMQDPLIQDIMNPNRQGRFEKVDISPSVLDNFREGMYQRLKDNLNYNINKEDQTEAITCLLDNMDASPAVLNSILTDDFEDYSKKGLPTAASSEFNKLINIMKGKYSPGRRKRDEEDIEERLDNYTDFEYAEKMKKKREWEKDASSYEPSYNRFKDIIRKKIGGKIEEKIEEQSNKVYKKSINFLHNLNFLQNELKENHPLQSLLIEKKTELSTLIKENENNGNFDNPVQTGEDIHFLVQEMFEEISEELLSFLEKDPNNKELIALSNKITNIKFDINNFKSLLKETKKILEDSEVLLNNINKEEEEREQKIIDITDTLNKETELLNKEREELKSSFNNFLDNIKNKNNFSNEDFSQVIDSFIKNSSINLNLNNIEKSNEFILELKKFIQNNISSEDFSKVNKFFKDIEGKIENSFNRTINIKNLEEEKQILMDSGYDLKSLQNISPSNIELMLLDKNFVSEKENLLKEGKSLQEIGDLYIKEKNIFSEDLIYKNININNINKDNITYFLNELFKNLKTKNEFIIHSTDLDLLFEAKEKISASLSNKEFFNSLMQLFTKIQENKFSKKDLNIFEQMIKFLEKNQPSSNSEIKILNNVDKNVASNPHLKEEEKRKNQIIEETASKINVQLKNPHLRKEVSKTLAKRSSEYPTGEQIEEIDEVIAERMEEHNNSTSQKNNSSTSKRKKGSTTNRMS